MLCHNSSKISARTENEHCRTTKKHSLTEFPPWRTYLGRKVSLEDDGGTPVRRRQAPELTIATSRLLPEQLNMASSSIQTASFSASATNISTISERTHKKVSFTHDVREGNVRKKSIPSRFSPNKKSIQTTSFSAPGTNIFMESEIVCLWDPSTYYPGVVTKIHSCTPATYDVRFNDGDTQSEVPLQNILDLTLYMGTVTTQQEQQSTAVTGKICAIRPLKTNFPESSMYDPKNYEYRISGTGQKKKDFFQSIDCITTQPAKVPLFVRTKQIAKQASSHVPLKPTPTTDKTASYHNQHTHKETYTTQDDDTLLKIVQNLQTVHQTCELGCSICKGLQFRTLTTEQLLNWNLKALPKLKLSSKLRAGTDIRYEIQGEQQQVQAGSRQPSTKRADPLRANASNRNEAHAISNYTKGINSNTSLETNGSSPKVTDYIMKLEAELRQLRLAAAMKSSVRDEHDNIQSVSMSGAQSFDSLDRNDREAEFQLRLKEIQQKSANAGRIKYQKREISANIRAIHPRRKRLNGRNDFVFNGLSLGNRPTRTKWIQAFLMHFQEFEQSPDSQNVDQTEARVLLHYNSITTSPALTLAIQKADAEIAPIILDKQQKSAQCDFDNLAKEKERKRKRSQRQGGDHKTKLETFHASLGHSEEMSLTLVANPRCKDSVRIISSHDGGAHQVYAMSQLFDQDKLFRSIVGDVAALATPTVHPQQLRPCKMNTKLIGNVKSFCGKLLTAIHESAAKQLECSTKKLSKASILKSVWPYDIHRHTETKSFFRDNNRCLICVLSVIKLLKGNECIKLHAKPRHADSHALRTSSHISGMSEFFTSLAHSSAFKIERKNILRVTQMSEGPAQDPVATVYFDHGFANELINIVTSQDNFNEAESWPEIKVLSERDTSQDRFAGTPKDVQGSVREGGGGREEGPTGELGAGRETPDTTSKANFGADRKGGGRGGVDRVSQQEALPQGRRSSMLLTEFVKFQRIPEEEAVASVRICIDILYNLSKNKFSCFVLLTMDFNSYYYFVMHSGTADFKKILARENSSDYSPV